MDDLLEELRELYEQLARSGFPEADKLIGKEYVCKSGAHLLCGTITSIDDATDDGYPCLGISSKFYRGDEIKYIVVLSAKHLQLAVSDGNGGVDHFHAELRILP